MSASEITYATLQVVNAPFTQPVVTGGVDRDGDATLCIVHGMARATSGHHHLNGYAPALATAMRNWGQRDTRRWPARSYLGHGRWRWLLLTSLPG